MKVTASTSKATTTLWVKECVTGRIMRLGCRARVGAVIPPYARARTDTTEAIMVTEGDALQASYEPGTLLYVVDPGSLGQDTESPDRYTAWACVVLPRGADGRTSSRR